MDRARGPEQKAEKEERSPLEELSFEAGRQFGRLELAKELAEQIFTLVTPHILDGEHGRRVISAGDVEEVIWEAMERECKDNERNQ